MKERYSNENRINKSDLYSDSIRCMVRALEYRDYYTKGHSLRVGEMAALCARELKMQQGYVIKIHIAGQLHDIGKIGVPDYALLKKGKLTEEEWKEIKKHPAISADIIGESEQLSDISTMVRQHHERWDGKGYPDGLKGEEIEIGGRILALCDAIDAMASARPYRESLSWDYIEQEAMRNMGLQFDNGLKDLVTILIDFWRRKYESQINILNGNIMFIQDLKDQHNKIYTLIERTRLIVEKKDYKKHGTIICQNISQLASILEIHLDNEDRLLYPSLIKSNNTKAQSIAKVYNSEMGDLSNEYSVFKTKFHSSMMINENIDLFEKEYSYIFGKLLNRLNKEDQELYPIAEAL